jgi:hypothetical protein
MPAGLRALLGAVVDYAGLFPPANLSLEQALRNYARYRTAPEAWMLGRFVCLATRLVELAPFHDELLQSGPPFVFSALGRGGTDADTFLAGLRDDLDAIAAFQRRHGERVQVDVYELRLPPLTASPEHEDPFRDLLERSARLLEEEGRPGVSPFYEMTGSSAAGNRERVTLLCSALRQSQSAVPSGQRPRSRSPGFKLRCGGLDAAAFPTPAEVAAAIWTCHEAGVALKFTAGLHHPLRHFSVDLRTPMHGFINVFVAGVLVQARNLHEEQVRAIVAEEDPARFAFDETGCRWGEYRATVAEIAAARRQAVTSFGSCSFDEPRDDLRALGWLPGQASPATV